MSKSAIENYRDYWLNEVSQSRRIMLGVGIIIFESCRFRPAGSDNGPGH